MTPEVPAVLSEVAQLLARNAQPGMPEPERANALTLASMLLALAAETWDGAAEMLVQENRAVAGLLGDAAAEGGLRLSALRAENARLRGLLIDAHVAAEATGDTARQKAIWAE